MQKSTVMWAEPNLPLVHVYIVQLLGFCLFFHFLLFYVLYLKSMFPTPANLDNNVP